MHISQVKKLHDLVIHGKGVVDPKWPNGTNREYYEETRQIAKIRDNSTLLIVCRKCFKKPH